MTREAADGWAEQIAAAGRSRLVELAIARGDLSEADALRLLRHPYGSEAVVTTVVAARQALAASAVRKAVALHPAARRADALRMLEHLGWRDLVDVGRSVRTPAPVRAAANRLVDEKLPRLAKGERLALARLADRPLLPALLRERDMDVVVAALRNPRLVVDDLVAWISTGSPPAAALAAVAQDGKWRLRPRIRDLLLRSAGTPRSAQLALLKECGAAQLRELASCVATPRLLAAWAERLLEGAPEGARTPGAARRVAGVVDRVGPD